MTYRWVLLLCIFVWGCVPAFDPPSDQAVAIRIMAYVGQVLTEEEALCGGRARAMAEACRTIGIPTRLIQTINAVKPEENHVMVEACCDGTWRLFDPSWATFWDCDANGFQANFENGLWIDAPSRLPGIKPLCSGEWNGLGPAVPLDARRLAFYRGISAHQIEVREWPDGVDGHGRNEVDRGPQTFDEWERRYGARDDEWERLYGARDKEL